MKGTNRSAAVGASPRAARTRPQLLKAPAAAYLLACRLHLHVQLLRFAGHPQWVIHTNFVVWVVLGRGVHAVELGQGEVEQLRRQLLQG